VNSEKDLLPKISSSGPKREVLSLSRKKPEKKLNLIINEAFKKKMKSPQPKKISHNILKAPATILHKKKFKKKKIETTYLS